MNCTLLTIDDDDEGSEDKDAHIRNGETVPKQLEAPPLGQTLGLKRFTATEFSSVFDVNTCIAQLRRTEYSMQYSKCSKCSKYTNLVQKYCACARTHFALTLALQILGIEQYCSIAHTCIANSWS